MEGADRSELAYQLVSRHNQWGVDNKKSFYLNDVVNAIIGPTFSHPAIQQGEPFSFDGNLKTDVEAVVEGYARARGGGRSKEYLWWSLRKSLFAQATKRLQDSFQSAGFTVSGFRLKKKRTAEDDLEKMKDESKRSENGRKKARKE